MRTAPRWDVLVYPRLPQFATGEKTYDANNNIREEKRMKKRKRKIYTLPHKQIKLDMSSLFRINGIFARNYLSTSLERDYNPCKITTAPALRAFGYATIEIPRCMAQ
jgi:hypothetical protein